MSIQRALSATLGVCATQRSAWEADRLGTARAEVVWTRARWRDLRIGAGELLEYETPPALPVSYVVVFVFELCVVVCCEN